MMLYAFGMIFVYPLGIPALYFDLIYHRHGTELQLLRRLELKRLAMQSDLTATTKLSLSYEREDTRSTRRSGGSFSSRDSSRRARAQLRSTKDQLEASEQIRKTFEEQEAELRDSLPDYVQKLILGYELRAYYFELIECFRKLAIVCLPVFFRPSGSVSQLIFGLMVCFLSFGVHMLLHPYEDDQEDRLAQLCQVHHTRPCLLR
eukprot:3501526-Prymnesium_polylepis.2